MTPTMFQRAQLQRVLNDSATAYAETPAVPILQSGRLLEQIGHDRGLLRDLIAIFLEDYPEHLELIEQGIRAGNSRQVRVQAHLLSGTAAQFGAWVVYRLAQRLERLGAAGELADAEVLFSELTFALQQVRPLLLAMTDAVKPTALTAAL